MSDLIWQKMLIKSTAWCITVYNRKKLSMLITRLFGILDSSGKNVWIQTVIPLWPVSVYYVFRWFVKLKIVLLKTCLLTPLFRFIPSRCFWMQEHVFCERLLVLINVKSSWVPHVCSVTVVRLVCSVECSFLQLSVFNLQGFLAPPAIMDSLHAQITPRYCAGFANYFLIVQI